MPLRVLSLCLLMLHGLALRSQVRVDADLSSNSTSKICWNIWPKHTKHYYYSLDESTSAHFIRNPVSPKVRMFSNIWNVKYNGTAFAVCLNATMDAQEGRIEYCATEPEWINLYYWIDGKKQRKRLPY